MLLVNVTKLLFLCEVWHHPAIETVCCYDSHTIKLSIKCHLYENLKKSSFFH